jgi:hypothetical protein
MEEEPADKDGGFRKIDLDGEGANESTADGHRRRRNLSISDGVKLITRSQQDDNCEYCTNAAADAVVLNQSKMFFFCVHAFQRSQAVLGRC